MTSRFAGEPSLDNEDNVYFTHHFFKDGKMIEADIYTLLTENKGCRLTERKAPER